MAAYNSLNFSQKNAINNKRKSNMIKPKKSYMRRSRAPAQSKKYNPRGTPPLTKPQKKLLRKIQKHGQSLKKQRYENWKSRTANVKGHSVTKQGLGFKNQGQMGLGFTTYFDKSQITSRIKRFGEMQAKLITSLTIQSSAIEMMERVVTRIKQTRHNSELEPFNHVSGDVFNNLINSLNIYDGSHVGRYIRFVSGSYDTGEYMSNPNNPTGIKGTHPGKTVNLSEMYEEGVQPFAYSKQQYVIGQGMHAARMRDNEMWATLKGTHPGFPKIQYLSYWSTLVSSDLTQRNFNKQQRRVIKTMFPKMPENSR